MTVRDVKERFGVSERTVLGWIRSGEWRRHQRRPVGRAKKPRWRISEEALEAFEQLRTATPPQPTRKRRGKAAGVIEFIK